MVVARQVPNDTQQIARSTSPPWPGCRLVWARLQTDGRLRGCVDAIRDGRCVGGAAGNGNAFSRSERWSGGRRLRRLLGCPPCPCPCPPSLSVAKHTVRCSPPGRGQMAGTSRGEAGKTKTNQENGGSWKQKPNLVVGRITIIAVVVG